MVKVDICGKYDRRIPEELNAQNAKQPWNQELFDRDPESASFANDAAAIIHTFVAKGLLVTKRARPDIRPAIAFLTTRVSIEIVLTLAMDDITVITCIVCSARQHEKSYWSSDVPW